MLTIANQLQLFFLQHLTSCLERNSSNKLQLLLTANQPPYLFSPSLTTTTTLLIPDQTVIPLLRFVSHPSSPSPTSFSFYLTKFLKGYSVVDCHHHSSLTTMGWRLCLPETPNQIVQSTSLDSSFAALGFIRSILISPLNPHSHINSISSINILIPFHVCSLNLWVHLLDSVDIVIVEIGEANIIINVMQT